MLSGGVSTDAIAGGVGAGLLGPLGGLLGGFASLFGGGGGSSSGGGAASSNGAFAPSQMSYGPFGLLTKTLPGSVGDAPAPTYANTLQFGPIPAMASTSPTPLTPMAGLTPLPGPAPSSGAAMGMAPSENFGGGPNIGMGSSPGAAPSSPTPASPQLMPQLPQQPSMPYATPFNPAQSTSPEAQPSGVGGGAPAQAAPPITPWQRAALDQMAQAGTLSPASISQATMPTVLSGTVTNGPPTLVPPPPPYQSMMAQPMAPYTPNVNGMPITEDAAGHANLLSAAAGYPAMLAQNLNQSKENVAAFNHALLQGSAEIEQAAQVVKDGIMAPAKKEMDDLQASGMLETMKDLNHAIQKANAKAFDLSEAADNVGLDQADHERAHKTGEAFAGGGKQRANFIDFISGGVETQTATAKANTLRLQAAQQQELVKGYMTQMAALREQFNKAKDRYMKSQELAETAANDMRQNYYKAADAMLGGVKGINELQTQSIRASIADQQHQGLVEQQATANQLTRDKMQEAADANKMKINADLAKEESKGYQEAEKRRNELVGEAMKKLRPGMTPEQISKALSQFMKQVDVKPAKEEPAFADIPGNDIVASLKGHK
jgi:hypothetical protein